MTVTLALPDDLAQSFGSSPEQVSARVAVDLAVYYYETDEVSMGKAVELSGLRRWEFERILAERAALRNYNTDELDSDLDWTAQA